MIPSVPYHNVVMKILSYSGFIGNKKYIQGLNLNISGGVCFFCILFFFGSDASKDFSRAATPTPVQPASLPMIRKGSSWSRGRDPYNPSIPPKAQE